MAYEEALISVTFPSSGDLSSAQYLFGRLTTAGTLGPTTARGAAALGIIQDNSTQANFSTKLGVYGISKVAAGDSSGTDGTITFMTPLMASSVGRAVPTTLNIGDHVLGYALQALTTGTQGVISMLIRPTGPSSS